MSVITTIVVPAEDVTLGAALGSNPGLRVRLERVVPVGDAFVPYIWASDDDAELIEDALRNESDIESYRVVDATDGEVLFRVEWAESVDGLFEALAENGGVILEGIGGDDVWRMQLRFESRDQVTRFYRQCTDRGVSVDVASIHNPGLPSTHGLGLDLTDAQRETLHLALEEGYFEVPRRINLVELAEQQGISDTAVSQRLRRGISALLTSTLRNEDAGDEP